MEDNSIDPKIRDQAEAVHNMMKHTGKALGPAGVKDTLEWITRGGKDVDFVQNRFVERTERKEPEKRVEKKREDDE